MVQFGAFLIDGIDGACPHGEYYKCQMIAVENGVSGSCKLRSAVALPKEKRVQWSSAPRNVAGLPVCSDTWSLASWPQAASTPTLDYSFRVRSTAVLVS